MSITLGNPIESAVDGENNPIEFDIAYPIRRNLVASIEAIRAIHGADSALLPMSGMSCGGGIFSRQAVSRTVVGLQFQATLAPAVKMAGVSNLSEVDLDEIFIDTKNQQVCAGAAITLDQLNVALAEQLGAQFKVAGADLTSYQYAAVGATFMTGGMGPQRRYFSDSVSEISIYRENQLEGVSGEALKGYAGTYGWTGIVSAVRCRYHRFPENEIAFAIPVSNQPEKLARFLQQVAPFCYFELQNDRPANEEIKSSMILGLEHVTTKSMGPMLRSQQQEIMHRRAHSLLEKCEVAGKQGLIFVSGFSDLPVDEFLFQLVDDIDAPSPCIAGISLEHSEIFNHPDDMRLFREAIPFAARTQSATGKLVFKNHCDATIRLHPDEVEAGMRRLWQLNCAYVAAIEDYFANTAGVNGEILVYGHLNPFGVDPHNRITFSCDETSLFETAQNFVIEQRAIYYRGLKQLCDQHRALFIGGEKSADSEREMYHAFGGIESAPAKLREKFAYQTEQIKHSASSFNWRALPPYL
ncbi:MAG: hypothetical protein ACI9LO_000413 [Planctomycetota bacterium]|jgi:hypothetical protein